jgi:hypothetical protein
MELNLMKKFLLRENYLCVLPLFLRNHFRSLIRITTGIKVTTSTRRSIQPKSSMIVSKAMKNKKVDVRKKAIFD